MFQKLQNRFLIVNMTMISILMIIAFAIIYSITYKNIQAENRDKFNRPQFTRINTSPDFINGPNGGFTGKQTFESSIMSFDLLVYENGQVIPGTAPDYFNFLDKDDYQKAATIAWKNKDSEGKLKLADNIWQYKKLEPMVRSNHFEAISATKIIFVDITDSQKTLNTLLMTFIIVALLMIVAIYFISLFFAKRAIQPISDAWHLQKQFVADASHELKTPLAIINANSDALLVNEDDTIRNQKKWLIYIKQETGRMSKLMNDLLYLARTENTDVPANEVTFDLSELTNEVILPMEAVIFEKQLKLHYDVDSGLFVKGDPDQIKQVIVILLDNAIKYSLDQGEIIIKLQAVKKQVQFSISNQGNEIAKDDLKKIFLRFYRTDPSRAKETGGYGLGLSVAKAIIERHHGKIQAESQQQVNRFMFELPSYINKEKH